MKIIDTKGKLCPAPLILTKRALVEATSGEEIEVLMDNDTACSNLRSYLDELNIVPVQTQKGDIISLKIMKPFVVDEGVDEMAYCSSVASSDYVVVLKSNVMGTGDDSLGAILLRAFINSLKEVDRLPSSIVIYNSGVMVAIDGTDTADSLKELEALGVTIITCGTCLDFYDVKDQLSVGVISNMYKITTVLAKAGHVVYP